MLENYPNKMMNPDGSNPDQITVKATSPMLNEYHFAGSGKWKPMAIKAIDIETATAIWQKKRIPVEEPANQDIPADETKVVEKETNKE
jgi:hypothetical protein